MDIEEILDCMSLLSIPIKKNSNLWKKLLECMENSTFALNTLEIGLDEDLDECSMSEVEMIDDYTTKLEGYVAIEFIATVMAAGKKICNKLKAITQAFSEIQGELTNDSLLNSLKACTKFRRFMSKNKRFIQNHIEFTRLFYSISYYEDVLRLKRHDNPYN
ncbi:hypothetical protein SteCoe_14572 [Stentor coeruleus]|uniref:Spindle pole body component n=1 Tax=Stentor coeruleus TaxID=5963 RepID=A0A1R2C5R0_9CILI|nr:hypothetical protein SteCoe_14572 [Stentor coeruleus]